MHTISEALVIAVQHHQAGQLSLAEQVYRQILAADPNQADALHLLGVIAFQVGQPEAAIEYIQRAIELNGLQSGFHCNLGNAFRAQGKLEGAAAAYRRALELWPDFIEAQYNLGIAFLDLAKLDDAVACFRRTVELKPDYPEAHNGLGTAFLAQEKLDKAIVCFRRALEHKPDYAEAYNNLGNALQAQGMSDEAVACYTRALQIRPEFCEAHNNLGNVFQALSRLDESVNSYHWAIELKPDYAEAYRNLGSALKDQGRLDKAIDCFRRELELRPDNWVAHSNLIYMLHFSSKYDAAAIYEEHCLWNWRHAKPLAGFIQPHANEANPYRRLRVGYVSPNFRNHPVAFFLTPLFSQHDHEQFEIFCYSDVIVSDQITAKLRSYGDVWRTTNGLTDEAVAQLVRDDKIDILVDLTMHMSNGRPLLFARKPAPVQVCWLAYPGTTGLATMDYRLTDPYLDPPGLFDRFYAEESVRLPETFWCYDPLANQPTVNSLPAGKNGYTTFGSLNSYFKIDAAVLRLWGQVIKTVEGSRLMLLCPEGSHRQAALDLLQTEGIDPRRITFVNPRPRAQYLELYHQIDIGLDPLPYSGHTTSLDSFWMGVPVVTIVGSTVQGRAGVCQLNNLGLSELIGTTPDDFVRIAAELANDPGRLSNLRANLRSRMQASPLMDAPRFARNIESAYRWMWKRWSATRHDSASA